MTTKQSLNVNDISRLLNLILEIADEGHCTPTQAIEKMTRALAVEAADEGRRRRSLAEFVSHLRRLRLRRNELLGAPLFRDPAWDMLLELYVAPARS